MLTWFPGGLIAVVVGVCMFSDAQLNLTPYSVSVRGYRRSDGTYVRSHSRRPPGSVSHDEPYESMRFLSVFVLIAGFGATGIPVYICMKATDWELLPMVSYDSNLPEKPRDIRVPRSTAKARADWFCTRCRLHIRPRDTYYYYFGLSGRYQKRIRFCHTCQGKLMREYHSQMAQVTTYQEAVKKEEGMKRALLIQQYKRYYGHEPSEGTNIPLHRSVDKGVLRHLSCT